MSAGTGGVTLSVCMIVRDEEPVLERCLRGVSDFADEIVVADTGSVDCTREIAARFTDRVYDFPWIDDFSAARNFSYAHAAMDYVMWLDADDVVTPENARKIRALKSALPPEADVVYLRYGADADQANIYNNVTLLRDRWMRRSLSPRWEGRVHEGLVIPPGARPFFAEEIEIVHRKVRVNDPGRNMRIYQSARARGQSLSAREAAYLCAERYDAGEYGEVVSAFEELCRPPIPLRAASVALPYYVWSMKALGLALELKDALSRLWEAGLRGEFLLCELGDAHLRRKEYDEAARFFTTALETPVDYRDLLIHFDACREFVPCQKLCKIHAARGDWARAYACFQRAAAVYPDNPGIRLNRLLFQKRFPEGLSQ